MRSEWASLSKYSYAEILRQLRSRTCSMQKEDCIRRSYSILFILFPLCISVWEVSIHLSSNSFIFSLALSSLLLNPSKAFFTSASVFLISAFSFEFLLEFQSLCLYHPSVFNLFYFILFFKHLYWSIIALQWCVSFCFITK